MIYGKIVSSEMSGGTDMGNDRFFMSRRLQSITLESMLMGCDTFEEFERKVTDEFLNEENKVGNYLQQLVWKYGADNATVSQKAGLHKSYVGNIINGKKNNPGRDVLIAICLALGADIDEVQYLLKYSGHSPLYVRRKRDVIIWFGIMKGNSIEQVDQVLFEKGYKTLIKYD